MNSRHNLNYIVYDHPLPLLTWPGLPNEKAVEKLALLHYLNQSQWFNPQQLRRHQFQQLQLLFSRLCQTVPYYRDNYYAKFFNVENSAQLKENWQNIPILTRSQLQQNCENLKNIALPEDHGTPSVSTSSGSTGKPVIVLTDLISQFFSSTLVLRHVLWHQWDFTKTLAIIHHAPHAKPPLGNALPTWRIGTQEIIKTGRSFELDFCDPEQQLAWILKIKPDYLITYPTVLRALLQLIPEKILALQNLKFIGTFSEIVTTELRQELKEKLHISIIDTYSCMEFGLVASQCPEYDCYHVHEENILVEVLNNENKPCKPGEIGRLVMTGLHNFAMPLVRYEIGDYAEVGEPCRCGRSLMTLKRIWGRERNMITLPSGAKRWPVFGIDENANLFDVFENAQFQIIQRTLYDIEVSVVYPEGKLPEVEIIPILQKIFGYPFNFTFNYVDNISRSANGKFEDFKSEIL